MSVWHEALQQLPAHALGWGIGQHNSALRFQSRQLVVQGIIFLVADQRRIQRIVVVIVVVQLRYQFFHSFYRIHAGNIPPWVT
ncbi:hypothetical protein D3C73_1514770 [compost metagenome]